VIPAYSQLVLAQYSDSLNKFTEYRLNWPVRLSGTFYVGTIQTTDDNLNIGFDTFDNANCQSLLQCNGALDRFLNHNYRCTHGQAGYRKASSTWDRQRFWQVKEACKSTRTPAPLDWLQFPWMNPPFRTRITGQ